VARDEDGGSITGATPIPTISRVIGTSSTSMGPHSSQGLSPHSSMTPRGISRRASSQSLTTGRIQRLSPKADYDPPEATVSHLAPVAAGSRAFPSSSSDASLPLRSILDILGLRPRNH
jgi:hypothetical protein